MASIASDPNGYKRVLFVAPNGSRKAIRLGKIDRKSAKRIGRHIEALLAAKMSGQPVPQATAVWLTDIGEALYAKLAAVGLVEARKRATLGEFLDTFIAQRKATAAPHTIANLKQAKRQLVEYFGTGRDMASITPVEAEAWAAAIAKRYAPATASRIIQWARQFFKAALQHKLVTENVFLGVEASDQDRPHHVAHDIIFRIIGPVPDDPWRLMITLRRLRPQ